MKKFLLLLLLLSGTVLGVGGCNFDHFPPRLESYPPANENLKNLTKIKRGMTQDEVREILGAPIDGKGLFARSPNIWWYYTQTVVRDGHMTTEECTPVCFDGTTGKLIGWGNAYYDNYIKYGNWEHNPWLLYDREIDRKIQTGEEIPTRAPIVIEDAPEFPPPPNVPEDIDETKPAGELEIESDYDE